MRAVGANREVIATDALTVARLADAVLSQQHGQEDHRTVLGITVLIPIGAGNADCYTAARPAVTAPSGSGRVVGREEITSSTIRYSFACSAVMKKSYARFPDGPAGGGEAFRNQPGAEVLSRRDCPNTRQLPLMRGTRRDARAIDDLLTRSRGRPSHTPLVRYRSFQYRTASWDRPRRGIAKIEHHLRELFPPAG